MKQTLQKVHLTYEILSDKTCDEEYRRAIGIALAGGDPTLQMNPSARRIYQQHPPRLSPALLNLEGQRILRKAKKLTTGLQATTTEITASDILPVYGLVITAAVYYKQPHVHALDRMVLARSITTMLLALLNVVEKHGDRIHAIHSATKSVREHTQSLHVHDPNSPEFAQALDNVIFMKDYIEAQK